MQNSLTPLRQTLAKRLTLSELQDLCFDLGLEYENLPSDTRNAKVISLLKTIEQHKRLDDLRAIGQAQRSDIDWDALCPALSEQDDQARSAPVRFLPADLPTSYIERTGALAELRAALLQPQPHVGVVAATAVHGEGGLGKTVLARAICDDEAIRARYPDGVLWATLGQSADPARHQREWIAELGGDVAAASSLERGKVELRRALEGRAMLLILDDIWHAQDAEPLQVSAPGCGILLTTRDAAQVPGAALVRLNVMTPDESHQLLRTAARDGQLDDALADRIAARLGRLPLALQIAGALLRSGLEWDDIAEALDAEDLTFLEHGQRSVLAVIDKSVKALLHDQAKRYHELVIFPRAESLHPAVVVQLWAWTAGLKRYQANKLLMQFRERALIQANNTLHDLHVDYLHAVVAPEEQRRIHSALVDSYGEPAAWGALPDDEDMYGWRNLALHLDAAGRADDLRRLLTDGAYLQGKIMRLGTAALLDDFVRLPDDAALKALAGAVRLGAHVLDSAPEQLMNQLQGGLGDGTALLTKPVPRSAKIILESQTLTPPGGSLLRTLAGHTLEVWTCAFSPDGRLVLSGSQDGTLRLWEVASGQLTHLLEGHTDGVRACAFSPDGRLILSASGDGTLQLWEVASGQPLHLLEGHTSWISTCAFSPDGRLVLSGSRDGTLRLWEVASGQSLHLLQGHTKGVIACAFSLDGRVVLSASWDGTLRLWEVVSGQLTHRLEGHTSGVQACSFSPDGRLVLSSSRDGTLRLWEVASGKPTHRLEGHTAEVNACAFSPDGRLVLSASQDRTLRLWEVASGKLAHLLEGHTSWVRACAFSPDGRLVLSASDDGTLQLWEVRNGQPTHRLEGHTDGVWACAFSPDGRLVLSASNDSTLRLWEVKGRQPTHRLEGHADGVWACVFSPDGGLALSGSDDGTLRLWDVASRQLRQCLEGHTNWVQDCAFSSDGRLVLSASDDSTLRLWEVASGKSIQRLKGHTAEVNACAFSPDGRLVASASNDSTLRLWEVASGQLTHRLEGHIDEVHACMFSPDGRLALSGSEDGTLRLWEVASGQLTHRLEGHTKGVSACTFSPDSRLVLSASEDNTLRLWEVESGQPTHLLEGHTFWVETCAFSRDGRLVLSASWDYTLRLWEVASGQPTHLLEGHTNGVSVCVFSPDGRLILSTSEDGTLRLWEVANGQERACWHADAPLLCCALHPDGRRVIAGDQRGALHWLRLQLDEVPDGAA